MRLFSGKVVSRAQIKVGRSSNLLKGTLALPEFTSNSIDNHKDKNNNTEKKDNDKDKDKGKKLAQLSLVW